MLLFIWARQPLFLFGPAPLSLSHCPMGPARHRHHRPTLLSRPTRQPHPSPSVRPAARARRTSRVSAGFRPLPPGRRSPVGGDPPARAPLPPRVGHVARPPPPPPASPAPSQKEAGQRRRASAPFFPPPSSLRAPRGKPRHRPSVSPSEHRFLTRIPVAAPPPFTRSVSRRLSRFPVNLDPTSPHSLPPRGAELGPCRRRPPCPLHRRRPPPRRTVPLPPPTRHRLGEPRRRSSCPVPPRDPTGARRQHLAADQPPPRWAESPGHGLTAVSVGHAWQAAAPRGL
jgi:hypothetical protein